ncbi:unnamed protein product [Onchocerca flexuosa]|uniref:Tyrosine-protein phosphatase domain-containing protein n=1 Tax=Onchocerca flexuosa TaxID=387005 RepID=A0A183I418_9BILA|nr:unnamed protein product [Onchocerca flexuosa]
MNIFPIVTKVLNSVLYTSLHIVQHKLLLISRRWKNFSSNKEEIKSRPNSESIVANNIEIKWTLTNGGGRSGVFLSLDANLELLKKTGKIDVFGYGKVLFNSRPHMIESVNQYQFIYDALAEALLCDNEPFAMSKLGKRSSLYKVKKERQLMDAQVADEAKLLAMLTPTLRIGDCAGGHRLENRGKNRSVMVVPPDHARPYLQTLHGKSKDYTYINAVEVDGFKRKKEFIVTEWPKKSTVDSFWTLIFDHSAHTVISLTNRKRSRKYPPFLHNKGKHTYGPFVVEILSHHQYPSMSTRMIKIMKKLHQIKAELG